MLRTRTPFQRTLARISLQIGGSVAATLIASVIYQTLPKAPVVDRPVAALTSGGKFAARVPGADQGEETGLTERQVARPVMLNALAGPMLLPADNVVWTDSAKPLPSADAVRPLKPRPHVAAQDTRRPTDSPSAALASKSVVGLAVEGSTPTGDDGVIPKVMSSARSLWSMTSSAGGALLSRLTP